MEWFRINPQDPEFEGVSSCFLTRKVETLGAVQVLFQEQSTE